MADSAEKGQIAGQLAMTYMMAVAGEMLRRFPIDFLDLLLISTIANANAAPRAAEPVRGGGRKPATSGRAGISRNAVSRMLNVPLETVRRRVAGLIAQKVLVEQADGLAFATDNPMGIGNNKELYAFNLELLRRLFRELKAAGIDLD
jgi:hypothetical protein